MATRHRLDFPYDDTKRSACNNHTVYESEANDSGGLTGWLFWGEMVRTIDFFLGFAQC